MCRCDRFIGDLPGDDVDSFSERGICRHGGDEPVFGDRFDEECKTPARYDYKPVVVPDPAAASIDFGTEKGFKWLVETLEPFHTSITEQRKPSADAS